MNFCGIVGMTEKPEIESATCKIAQNTQKKWRSLASLSDVLEFCVEPISTRKVDCCFGGASAILIGFGPLPNRRLGNLFNPLKPATVHFKNNNDLDNPKPSSIVRNAGVD